MATCLAIVYPVVGITFAALRQSLCLQRDARQLAAGRVVGERRASSREH
jgi:hypothetical protein